MRHTITKTHVPEDFDFTTDAPKGASFADYLDSSILETAFDGLAPDDLIAKTREPIDTNEIKRVREQLCVKSGFLDYPGLKVSDADLLSSLMRVRNAIHVHVAPEAHRDVIVTAGDWIGPYRVAASLMDKDSRAHVLQHGGLNGSPQRFMDLYCERHIDDHDEPFVIREHAFSPPPKKVKEREYEGLAR